MELKNEDGTTFDEWFEILTYCIRKLKYEGEINRDYFHFDYDNDLTPEEVANTFIQSLNK